MRAFVRVCVFLFVRVCELVYLCAYVCACVHASVFCCVCARVPVYLCVRVRACVRVDVCNFFIFRIEMKVNTRVYTRAYTTVQTTVRTGTTPQCVMYEACKILGILHTVTLGTFHTGTKQTVWVPYTQVVCKPCGHLTHR